MTHLLTENGWFFRHTRVRDANGFDVCFLSPNPQYQPTEQDKRIGLLLAAAPELLKALERIIESYESHMHSEYDYPNDPWTPKRDGDETYMQARAAIAKAKGEL